MSAKTLTTFIYYLCNTGYTKVPNLLLTITFLAKGGVFVMAKFFNKIPLGTVAMFCATYGYILIDGLGWLTHT